MFSAAFRLAMTGSFDPRSLLPILWYDGADPTTMWDATSGGSLVAPNGAIARWEDKSGNGWHLTQATSGARPTRKTATRNGRDVVNFNGAGEINTAAYVAFARTPAISAFYVFKSTVAGILFESSWDYNANAAIIVISEAGNKFTASHRVAGYTVITESTGSTDAYHIWSATHNTALSVNEVAFLRDGNARAAAYSWNTDNPSTGFPAHRVFVGARSGLVYPITAEIAEILIYPRLLTIGERQAVERYLGGKWAIPLV